MTLDLEDGLKLSVAQRIAKGHVRRFGESMIPLQIRRSDITYADRRWRVSDLENGSWSLWDCSSRRLRCVLEQGPTR